MSTLVPDVYGPVTETPLKWVIYGHDPNDELHNAVIRTVLQESNDSVVLASHNPVPPPSDCQPQQQSPVLHIDPRLDTGAGKLAQLDPDVVLFYPQEGDSRLSSTYLVLYSLVKTTLGMSLRADNSSNGKPRKVILATSAAGIHGVPHRAEHTAMRFALEGLIETVALEVSSSNCRAFAVDLGAAAVPADHKKRTSTGTLVHQLAHCANPPIRVAADSQAIASVNTKLRWIAEEIEDWKFLYEK